MTVISDAWLFLVKFAGTITLIDVIDILLVAYLIFKILQLIWDTKAWQVLKGIFLLLVILQFSEWVGMNAVNFILKSLMQVGLVALVVMFQPELRRALEKVGNTRLSNIPFLNFTEAGQTDEDIKSSINAVCEACEMMSLHKIGALIVFERQNLLTDVVNTGTGLSAKTSAQLIGSVFFPNSPLHDGALIIRGGKLLAAGCFLPLSYNQDISKELGTRHRAALGISEITDALVVVVSEETGKISLAKNRNMLRSLSGDTLRAALSHELIPAVEKPERKKPFRKGREQT